MDEELEKDAGDTKSKVAATHTKAVVKTNKKKKGLISRMWNALFRSGRDDFEKRLQHISKEEAAVIQRITRRSQSFSRILRNLIILSVLFEAISVGYAIMTTRSLDLNWKLRALRVLPMFLLPGLSFVLYSALGSFRRICDNKDNKTLERLRAERKAKIDELKERTNYYITQQLIQKYDPDPAAQVAAATVLASKLGADSGLKVFVGDETQHNAPPAGKSNDAEVVNSTGLRNRKQPTTRSVGSGRSTTTAVVHSEENKVPSQAMLVEGSDATEHHPLVVEHHNPTSSTPQNGGWISRIAALLVGEDPTQSYALICGNCHMHNGLARKEDFPYITYYCPHCNALNRHKQSEDRSSGSNTPGLSSSVMTDAEVSNNSSSSPVAENSISGARDSLPGSVGTEGHTIPDVPNT
ncbi:hypothetical protein DM860_015637 [Cuscuta australis]|uniref:Lunapark zinc ribbon domain-containing protein n=1 Tax=Cuscuta australis TaxID=267555 RepID=A0A328DEV8_9ASTE|nr:hypothetical protein DM860_015637 [Cuscuta australis]